MTFPDGSLRIEKLASLHNRSEFFCGKEPLDRYIRQQASQDIRRAVASVFVAVTPHEPERILGFFTLSAVSIVPSDLPEGAHRLPRHAVPAALIGRLAVDRSMQRRGLGGILVADATRKAMIAAQTVAMAIIVVDPIDDEARSFYGGFGFRSLQGPQVRMFLALPLPVRSS